MQRQVRQGILQSPPCVFDSYPGIVRGTCLAITVAGLCRRQRITAWCSKEAIFVDFRRRRVRNADREILKEGRELSNHRDMLCHIQRVGLKGVVLDVIQQWRVVRLWRFITISAARKEVSLVCPQPGEKRRDECCC